MSPVDALIVINDLKRKGSRILPPTEYTPPPYIDVDGSSSVEATDVLQVINYILRQSRTGNGGGEGEGGSIVVMAAPVVTSAIVSPSSSLLSSVSDRKVTGTGQQTVEAVRNAAVDVAIQSVSLGESQTIARTLSPLSASSKKRTQQTDAVFSKSLEVSWE